MVHLDLCIASDRPCVTDGCNGPMVFPDADGETWFQRDPMDSQRFDGYCPVCGTEIERWNTSPHTSRLIIRVVG